MKQRLTAFFKSKYTLSVVLISIAVAFLIHFPETISIFDHSEEISGPFNDIHPADVLIEVLFSFASLLVLFFINTLAFKFDKPETRITPLKVLLSFLLTWIISIFLGKLFVFIHHRYNTPAIHEMLHFYMHPIRDFIIAVIVTGGCCIIHLILRQQRIIVENKELRAENILNQYEALKNQLNPHMLFNSLNTLRSLIRENPAKAQEYIQELSKVLRYTLRENETKSSTLAEEIESMEAYIFLLQMRYEENLHFKIDIDKQFQQYRLPPMSLQLLIENAVKHNEISSRKPLTIAIYTLPDHFIVVSNPIQAKLTGNQDTGIGLKNLTKRYFLLFKREIYIENNGAEFTVKLPLIKPNCHENSDC